jgi:hypothetical protein
MYRLIGQLQDLLYIIESAGMPSKTNKYIFNGDFVDRGPYGVEVVCLLLAFHAAFPGEMQQQCGDCVVNVSIRDCISQYWRSKVFVLMAW